MARSQAMGAQGRFSLFQRVVTYYMNGSCQFTPNGRKVPQLHRPVRASGGQRAAVRAESQRGYADPVGLPLRQFTSGRDFQQSNYATILAARSDHAAVRAFDERRLARRLRRFRAITRDPPRPDLLKQRLPGPLL